MKPSLEHLQQRRVPFAFHIFFTFRSTYQSTKWVKRLIPDYKCGLRSALRTHLVPQHLAMELHLRQ